MPVCMCPENYSLRRLLFKYKNCCLVFYIKESCLSYFCAHCAEVHIKRKKKKVSLNAMFILVICYILTGIEATNKWVRCLLYPTWYSFLEIWSKNRWRYIQCCFSNWIFGKVVLDFITREITTTCNIKWSTWEERFPISYLNFILL